MMKQIPKKLTALVLAVMMVLTMVPFSAAAEEADEPVSTGANNGPSDGNAYIYASLVQGDGFSTQIFSVQNNVHRPYEDKLVYDAQTNTLVISDLNAYALDINEMGEDFKIDVRGYNSLTYMNVWGYGWGGSAFITGSGTLDLARGLSFEAEQSPSVLTVDKDVTLMAHNGGIYVHDSTAATPIVIKGRELSNGIVGRPSYDFVSLPYESNPDWKDTVRVYHNATKPFSDNRLLADTEYFAVAGMFAREVREEDGEKHKCYKFAISEAVLKNGKFTIGSHAGSLYAWDDSLLYRMYSNNFGKMRISDIDPNYVQINMNYTEQSVTAIVDSDSHYLDDVAIAPQGSDSIKRPKITTKTLPDATEGKAYSAKITAQPVNTGGKIVDYTLSGTASEWLSIDSSGSLSGTAPAYGIYQVLVSATEEANGQRAESPMEEIVVKVDVPDVIVTFAKTISNGCAHTLTITDNSDKVVRSINLGTKDLKPLMVIDLSDLPDGSYTATLTGTITGGDALYFNNSEAFTVRSGQKTRVTMNPDIEMNFGENAILLNVTNLTEADELRDITATVIMNSRKEYRQSVTRASTLFPNLDKGDTLSSVYLTAKDDTGQTFEIASGTGNTLTIDTSLFDTYTVYCLASDIPDVSLKLNGYVFDVSTTKDYTFRKLGEGRMPTFYSACFTEENEEKYDLDLKPEISLGYGSSLYVNFPLLDRSGVLSGTVTDSDDEPIAEAQVTCSQVINGKLFTLNAVTDKDGKYRIPNLYIGKQASVTVNKTGYSEASDTVDDIQSDSECDLTAVNVGGVTVYSSDFVYDVKLTWSGADEGRLFVPNGYSFELPIDHTVNGEITVTMTGSNIAGKSTGTVTVKNGRGELTLTPSAKGTIDWSGSGDNPSYIGYSVQITGEDYSRLFSQKSSGSVSVDPGVYTVSILKPDSNDAYATQKLTVESNKTAFVTAKLPAGAEKTSVSTGKLTGPKTASTGETYKLQGLLTSISGKKINDLHFQIGDSMSWDNNIQHVVINGKAAKIRNGYVYSSENTDIDWSLPLNFTVYCTQKADVDDISQTVSAYVNAGNSDLIGSVVTQYAPKLTLSTVKTVGGVKDKNQQNAPDAVSFIGKCSPNTEIRLYDNGTLCAITTTDVAGNYSGSLNLTSSSYYHILRAEADFGGETVTAASRCQYVADGAVLQKLTMNDLDIPINGGRIAYTTLPTQGVRFTAKFKNAENLDDITYTVKGSQVTSKVFFKVSTIGGYELIPAYAADKSGTTWSSKEYFHGADYPTGVKTLYKSKAHDYSYTVEFDDLASVGAAEDDTLAGTGDSYTATFDRAVERIDHYDKDNYVPICDCKGWVSELTGDTGTWDDPSMSASQKSGKIYQEIASVLKSNAGSRGKGAKAITAEQAAARCPSDEAQIRTYTDAPAYTVTALNLQLRKTQLEANGYESYYYKDRTSGHELYMFKGTFYYDKKAQPVAALVKTNIYNGIPVTEEDERMFKDGKPLGSTLEVTYVCDKTAKKWVRTQNAIISAGADSPIHTYSTQVPCKNEPPLAYKESAVNPVSLSGDDLAATGASAGAETGDEYSQLTGFCLSIDPKDVSAKTYGQFCVSLTSFGVSVYLSKGNTILHLPENMASATLADPSKGGAIIDAADFMTSESTIATFAFYDLGNNVGKVLAGSSEPYDAYQNMQRYLTNNIRWYGKVEHIAKQTDRTNNGGPLGDFRDTGVMATLLKQQSARVQNDLTAVQAAIESARNQGVVTDDITEKLGMLSLGCALIPGWGYLAAGGVDGISVLLNAARDTHNERLIRAVEDFNESLTDFMKLDREAKKSIKEVDEIIKRNRDKYPDTKTLEELMEEYGYGKILPPDPDEDPGSTENENPEDNDDNNDDDCELTPVHDPSGIVYEAVLSNPVKGASVTLYRYRDDDPLTVWDDSEYLSQQNPLITDENGFYRWDVPEGEWYVTAAKDGYALGSSQNDKAATVRRGDINYLPVLPPQLEVNIPLVSYAVPEVESAVAKTDGVYITFSKYMKDEELTADRFSLTDSSGKAIAFKLEKLDSEQAPDNVRYDGSAPFYTKTVRLTASLTEGSGMSLSVAGNLHSYAGVSMSAPYSDGIAVAKKTALSAPKFSAAAGEVDKGTIVTITCDDDAEIIYTTDGTRPSASNGTRAKSGAEICVIISTTVKAIAVRADAESSNTTTAEYTVRSDLVPERPTMLLGDVDGDSDVTIIDATIIQRHLASMTTSAFHEEVADTDGDGNITILDANAIQRYLAQLPHPDGIGEPVSV